MNKVRTHIEKVVESLVGDNIDEASVLKLTDNPSCKYSWVSNTVFITTVRPWLLFCFGKVWVFWEGHKFWKKIFVVLLTRASCCVRATPYLSKSWRKIFKTNVDKSYYTNFTFNSFQAVLGRNQVHVALLKRFISLRV